MKFSMFHLFPQPHGWTTPQVYEYDFQVIQWADELGFDCAWVAEHHFRDYGVVPNTMLLFAHLAARTKRLRLGNAIIIMPFIHPLRAAEDSAMVDILSGGRLNFGFGRGYQGVEFAGLGVSMDDTRARTDEALDIILKAWEGKPFSYHGRFYTIENVQVVPTPVQKPHPPVCFASISPESLQHYAARGIPFMVDGSVSTPALKESIALWKQIARQHGHDPEQAEIIASRSVHIAKSNEEARAFTSNRSSLLPWASAFSPVRVPATPQEQYARESAPIDPKTGEVARGYEYWRKGYLGRDAKVFDLTTDESWEHRWVAGDMDRVLRKIEELEQAGVKNLICNFAAQAGQSGRPDLKDMRQRMEQFAREVMPRFQRSGAKR